MEDIRQYLSDFVGPAIADFERNPGSIRHAFVACVVVFHTVDRAARPRRPANLRQEWKKQSHAFALVDAIAHAFKHVAVGNPNSPNLRARDVNTVPGAFQASAFQADAFQTEYVTLADDPAVNVLAVVTDAAAFVRAQFNPHP